MNTPNNKRRKESQNRIETAFVQLLQNSPLHRITVSDICKLAQVNRSTFYANYEDIFALVEAVQKHLENEVANLFGSRSLIIDFLPLFEHMQNNQDFYKTYFKLGLDGQFQLTENEISLAAEYYRSQYQDISHIEYHIEFFRNGFNAVVKKWLNNGCAESPEEMKRIVVDEYMKKSSQPSGD